MKSRWMKIVLLLVAFAVLIVILFVPKLNRVRRYASDLPSPRAVPSPELETPSDANFQNSTSSTGMGEFIMTGSYDKEIGGLGGAYGMGGAMGGGPRPMRTAGRIANGPGAVGGSITDLSGLALQTDEVWVIAKPQGQPQSAEEDVPGTGALLALTGQDTEEVPLPLEHTDVTAGIIGYIASVEVTQQFHNPFDTKIEAKYVFPLPQNAAINDFLMTIGQRTIRGIIRERREAEQIYQQARAQGFVTSLLTQERPNIFTQKVANIEPGRRIDVNIKYFNTLAYVDGWYEFVFPMVVGPRYNPPGSTDGVGAVARGRRGASGQSTELQYLAPHERSGHDISLAVVLDAGVKIEQITCNTHVIRKHLDTPETASVTLSDADTIPNKDFVLRYRVAGDRVKSALVTHQDERGGFW